MDAEQGCAEEVRIREALVAFVASGKTLKEYCEQTGQSYWTLRRWRLKYAEELDIAIRRRPGTKKAGAKRLVSRLVPIEISAAGKSIESRIEARVEIRLRGDRSVLVSPGIEAATLSRLIGAVERAA